MKILIIDDKQEILFGLGRSLLFEFIHHIDLAIIFQVNHNLGEGMEKQKKELNTKYY